MEQLWPIVYQWNIAEVDDQYELQKSKVLTLEMTEESGVDDPRVKILADEFRKQSQYEQKQSSKEPLKERTSANVRDIENELKQDQREAFEKAVEEYKLACLRTFRVTEKGNAIQTHDFPKPEDFKPQFTAQESQPAASSRQPVVQPQ